MHQRWSQARSLLTPSAAGLTDRPRRLPRPRAARAVLLALLWWGACALGALSALSAPQRAAADPGQTVYWRIQTNANPEVKERLIKALSKVLSQAEETHLLTDAQVAKHISTRALHIPDCYESARGCESLPMHLIAALQVDGLVVANLDAQSQTVTLRYWRASGGTPKEVSRTGAELVPTIRESVSALFTLEAILRLESEPAGANVFINGNFIGASPVAVRLGEGQHALRFEAEGYVPRREEVVLGAAEEAALSVRLEPILTQITVLTGAPNADVYLNDLLRGRAGEPFEIIPGSHALELRAAGYHPIGMRFTVAPAQRVTYRFAMLKQVEDPNLLRERAIAPYRLYVRPYYGLSSQSVAFSDSRFSVAGRDFAPVTYNGASRMDTTQNGFGVAAGYVFGPWGLMLLDVSGAWASPSGDVQMLSAGESLTATNAQFSRVSVRALQGTARYFWGGFSVEGITGLGVGFDSLTLDTPLGAAELNETRFFWSLNAQARYHWHEQWYASAGYFTELDFGGDRGLRHGLQLGVGFFLPWLTGHPDEVTQEDAAPDVLPSEPIPEIPELPPAPQEASP